MRGGVRLRVGRIGGAIRRLRARLKALNVPTEPVIYPYEGHAIAKPAHQRDIEERLLAWFDRYLMR